MKKQFIVLTSLVFLINCLAGAAQIGNDVKKGQAMAPQPAAPATKSTSKPVAEPVAVTASNIKVLSDSQFDAMMEQKKKILNDQMNFFLVELFEKQMEEYKKANEERKKAEVDRLAAAEERKKAEADRLAAAEERKKAFEDEKKKVEADKKLAAEERKKAADERKNEGIERKKGYVYDYELYKQEKYVNLILDNKVKHPQIISDVAKFFESDKIIDGEAKDVIVKRLKQIFSNNEKKEISIEDGINLQKYNKWLDVKSKLISIIEEKEKNLDTMKDISKYINNDSDVDGKNKEKVLEILRDSMNAVSK